MIKVDFTKVKVEVSYDGKTETVNIARDFANTVKLRTVDIGLEEFCRKVYFSTGEIEVPDEYLAPMCHILIQPDCQLFAFVKRALLELLTPNKEK